MVPGPPAILVPDRRCFASPRPVAGASCPAVSAYSAHRWSPLDSRLSALVPTSRRAARIADFKTWQSHFAEVDVEPLSSAGRRWPDR